MDDAEDRYVYDAMNPIVSMLMAGADPIKAPTFAQFKAMSPEEQAPWREALQKEYDELQRLGTFKPVRRSEINKAPVASLKVVFRTKNNGERKARLDATHGISRRVWRPPPRRMGQPGRSSTIWDEASLEVFSRGC
eukprot:scaffold1956_cov333-Prasinococcus_capsulatus_cf.AAC.1